MEQFSVAKSVLSFFCGAGVLVIGLGAVLAIYALSNYELVLIVPSVALVISGVLIIAIGQLGLAQIATAENTYAIYQLFRENLPNNSKVTEPFIKNSTDHTESLRDQARRLKFYEGKEILKTDRGIMVDGLIFANVLEAERWIRSKTEI